MPLVPIGIKNENDFYSSYYMDSLLENDIKSVLGYWNEMADTKQTPYQKLMGMSREYFKFCSDFDNEKNSFEKLKLQRIFFKSISVTFLTWVCRYAIF